MSRASLAPEVRLDHITVTFGSVVALDDVSLHLTPGVRHAIVGENGAGKSTLMRVLFGLQSPNVGSIYLQNAAVRFSSPADAMKAGIGMVQQHFELIDAFTVAENILLGTEQAATSGILFDRRRAATLITELAIKSGLEIDPNALVGGLSVAAQQRVEILKALYRNAKVLILDEPTAVLSPTQAHDLWLSVQRLADAGTTIVFVTHKLEDVMANADSVTVLRQGKHIVTTSVAATSPTALAEAMVGRGTQNETTATVPEATTGQTTGDQILSLNGVTVQEGRRKPVIEDITLTVGAGEIVGIAGVDGSGQTELLETIVGLRTVSAGTLTLVGQDITHTSPGQRRTAGLSYVPADRHRESIVLPLTCEENSVLGQQDSPRFSAGRSLLRYADIVAYFRERADAFDVRGAATGRPVRALSGGNQQKLVLARELATAPRLLVAAQPTRGLDFAATAFVHECLRQERNRGCAILLQSLDLDEVLALSDRVVVMNGGRIVAQFSRAEATIEAVGVAMTGIHTTGDGA